MRVVRDLRRAGAVHDVGRVAIWVGVWCRPGSLTPDQWEQVRLHGCHGERALCHSPFLARLLPAATAHHERLDGSGYHPGSTAAALPLTARLAAAADVYRALTERRPYRAALPAAQAAEVLRQEVDAGRLDGASAVAVLAAAGQPVRRVGGPAGPTEREAQVLVLLARGFQTKQVARALGISGKTADHHVQNAYAKIGVSTRAAAAVFVMEHGLIDRENSPYRLRTAVPSVGSIDREHVLVRDGEVVMRRIDAVRDRGSVQRNAASRGTRARAGLWPAGVAGAVGPMMFTVTFLVLERLRSGEFSPAEQPVSALEAGPYGWLQQPVGEVGAAAQLGIATSRVPARVSKSRCR